MPSATEFVSTMLEKVRPNVQSLVEMHEGLSAEIRKGVEAIPVSDRMARVPLQISNGGDFGLVNLDGGAMGQGSGMQFTHMELTYRPVKLGYEITSQTQYVTDSNEKALVNAVKKTLEVSMKEFGAYDDICFHNITGNQGVVAEATAVDSTSAAGAGDTRIYTCSAAFNVQLLRPNMPVEIFNGTTSKTATNSPDNLPRVLWLNLATRQVAVKLPSSFSGTYTPAANDRLCVAGTPNTTMTFKNGLYLFNSAATSGSLLNVDRTVYPEINSNVVVATGALIPAYITLLKDRIRQRRGSIPKDLEGYCHPAQQAAIAALGIAISNWNRGAADKMIDIMPGIGDVIPFGGINFKGDIRADRTRLDVISKSTWGRVRLKDADFFEVDGRKIFEKRVTGGGVAAAMLFYIVSAENFYCADPGSQGFVSNLPTGTGY